MKYIIAWCVLIAIGLIWNYCAHKNEGDES